MKIVINISKEKDMLGSYDENCLREINLSDDIVNEFKLKYESSSAKLTELVLCMPRIAHS